MIPRDLRLVVLSNITDLEHSPSRDDLWRGVNLAPDYNLTSRWIPRATADFESSDDTCKIRFRVTIYTLRRKKSGMIPLHEARPHTLGEFICEAFESHLTNDMKSMLENK